MPTVELAACQVYVCPDDYATEARFYALLERVGSRLEAARGLGSEGEPAHERIVVFPEMIGAFLPLAGRGLLPRLAPTVDSALALIALRELPSLARAMAKSRTLDPKIGFLLAASHEVRRIYRDAFSHFARRHKAWVIAGSALLPRNRWGDTSSRFEPEGGRVYNTSYTFSPSGDHITSVRKINLVRGVEDELGLTPGHADELPVVETPFGKIGTLICYDGFRVAHTPHEPRFCPLIPRYDEKGCAVIAQPAANPWPWEEPWVHEKPGGSRLRREQWIDEGLFSQLAASRWQSVRYAITSQLLGKIFDNRFDGRSHIIEHTPEGTHLIAEARRADISPEAEEVIVRAVEI